MWYKKLKIKNGRGQTINFTDWQKETVDTLDEHKNIKKVWLVNNQRKTGATYFAKLLMYFRPPCTSTFVISDNLRWSNTIAKYDGIYGIFFNSLINLKTKDVEYYKASRFLTPVTLCEIEKEIKKDKQHEELWESIVKEFSLDDATYQPSYECLYDTNDPYNLNFNIKTYNYLLSYNFDFFIINVSPKDLEKARPFIEADKGKEDVLIVNIENSLPNRNITSL